MSAWVVMFLALMVVHAIADYPLQGDFLARAKNHTAPIPGIDWQIALANHALIHAGGVAWVTGSVWLGVAEFFLHYIIDYQKCAGRTTFRQDQNLHAVCKLVWVAMVALA